MSEETFEPTRMHDFLTTSQPALLRAIEHVFLCGMCARTGQDACTHLPPDEQEALWEWLDEAWGTGTSGPSRSDKKVQVLATLGATSGLL